MNTVPILTYITEHKDAALLVAFLLCFFSGWIVGAVVVRQRVQESKNKWYVKGWDDAETYYTRNLPERKWDI